VIENKAILAIRDNIPRRCRISANINEFFDTVAAEAERAMLGDPAAPDDRRSLADILRLDEGSALPAVVLTLSRCGLFGRRRNR